MLRVTILINWSVFARKDGESFISSTYVAKDHQICEYENNGAIKMNRDIDNQVKLQKGHADDEWIEASICYSLLSQIAINVHVHFEIFWCYKMLNRIIDQNLLFCGC